MSIRNGVKQLLKMCGHALVSTVHERLNRTDWQLDLVIDQNNRLAHTQTALLESSIQFAETLQQWQQRQQEVAVEESGYGFQNPETGLMAFLYSFLPSRVALDIGAHTGEVSERLLDAGYEVYAFEPNPPVYARLVERLGPHREFHAFDCALAAGEAAMPLHVAEDRSAGGRYGDPTVFSSLAAHSMPEDLPFTGQVEVRVRTLAGLHGEKALPEEIGLVKIDTEGYDLEVIRGMGERRYPVVCAEFWDERIPFGQAGLRYTLVQLVREMKERGYPWHLVIYRIWGRELTAFFSNHPRAVPGSWGNVFFFRDHGLFREADRWCSAMLPRTYFRPVGQSDGSTQISGRAR